MSTNRGPQLKLDYLGDPVGRFWAQVDRSGDCWTWTGSTTEDGYGLVDWDGDQRRAHRISWLLAHGEPAPAALLVRHTCDNPPCVRPAHLLLGTVADNSADMWARGRAYLPDNRGERNGQAVLLDLEADLIRQRRAAGERAATLAAAFGVSVSLVYKIASGTRRQVP